MTTAITTRPAVPTGAPPAPSIPPRDRTLVVLETARAMLERGWLQEGWYRTAPRSWRERWFGPMPGPESIEAACLVAAVAVAGHAGGAFTHVDRDSGPALDRVWEAWAETRGRTGGDTGGDTGAVAPIVRRARMRDLVRWNDEPGRTRTEVLDVVDRAISRTIMARVAAPSV